jgi:hypothetical protein
MLRTKLPRKLRSRSVSLALLLGFILYFGYQEYWTEESVFGLVGSHNTSATAQWRGIENMDQLDLPWKI